MELKKHINTKKICFYAILIILIGFLALVLAEGSLRVLVDYLPESVKLRIHWLELGEQGLKSIPHSYTGFTYPPNSTNQFKRGDLNFTFSTDSKGFRNKDPWPRKADIVIVGDSLGFGYGVDDEQSWSTLVSRKFSAIKLINLALIGSGPEQYKRVLETFGMELEPKLVIFALFPDNDFWDALKFDDWLKRGARGNYDAFRLLGREAFTQRRGIKDIIKKTYLYITLKEVYSSIRRRQYLKGKILTFNDGSRMQIVPGQLENQKRMIRRDCRGYKLVIKALSETKMICQDNETAMFVLIFPSKESVYSQLKSDEDILKTLKIDLKKLDIEYLDLTVSFKEAAKKGLRLFYEIDGHPNHEGYKIVAEQTANYLKREYFLPDAKK